MKDFIKRLYIIAWMGLAVLFMYIIWNVTFNHIIEEYATRQQATEIKQTREELKHKQEKSTFQKVILESEETVKLYLGYRVLEEKRIAGHFHHIDFSIGPDKRSYCITCHGDMPHDNLKEIRAFLNMHSFFINCQTCHVKLEKAKTRLTYKWYDRTTGDLVDSPVMEAAPGMYKAKIIPLEIVNGKYQRLDAKEKIEFANEYREREQTLTEAQKSRAKKLIHKRVSPQPHICEDCHQRENPLLPLRTLGYPEQRIDIILSTEVVGMIKKYTEFYMPRMLHPGERTKK
ncbi:hypothetical protein BMS3Abin10_01067 [bacterium BMS3Abin10]|nr:hypothetical protein BMS3Abin10_01067 [bacterium BMS3Abin10]GBE38029.1 hypothetical protein BMS3Bbin08_00628 [bacterium BMS3Bbin08]HDH49833.1 hypothetical protein [Nitrospirota bacterium]HDK17225.1 hypothetical protein [Nitrospirota bacterium]HDK41463.1 hypothetical protein [Nitrospirota bacterium]